MRRSILIATVFSVTISMALPSCALMRPTPGRLAFAYNSSSNTPYQLILSPQQPDLRMEIVGRGIVDTATWSSTGDRIAFTCRPPSEPGSVCVASEDQNQENIVFAGRTDLEARLANRVVWSADDAWLIFHCLVNSTTRALCRVKADGGEAEVLVSDQDDPMEGWRISERTAIASTPDGEGILFLASPSNTLDDEDTICIYWIESNEIQEIVPAMGNMVGGAVTDFVWSPGSERLAVRVYLPENHGGENTPWSVIYVVEWAARTVTRVGAGDTPVWSPAGDQIAVIDEDLNVDILGLDGSRRTALERRPMQCPDSVTWTAPNEIVFTEVCREGGILSLKRIDISTGAIEILVSHMPGYPNYLSWSADSTWPLSRRQHRQSSK